MILEKKHLLPLLVVPLLAADEPEPAPPEEAPPVDAPPLEDGVEELVAQAPMTPEELLAECTTMLADGDYLGALHIAIPAISDHPDMAQSFEAVARLATDQLARQRGEFFPAPSYSPSTRPPSGVAPSAPQPGSTWSPPDPDPGPDTWRTGSWEPRPHPGADDPREGFLFGFDAGLISGARVEWKAKGRVVDGIGFQANLGTVIYDGLYLMPTTQVYMDFASRSDWQFETSLGILWYSGSAYPLIGVGAQWDPPRPIQVNLGVDVGLAVVPDVSIGFLW